MPILNKRAVIAACRAFTRVVFQGRPSVTLGEKYLISEEGALHSQKGQNNLKRFLDDERLVYQQSDALDVDLLLEKIIPGATPSLEHPGAYPASAVHERALSSDKVRLMLDGSPVRNSIIKAVETGKLVVRLPNGDVYDSQGCVTGPEENRRRNRGKRLSTLNLTSDVLVAPADAECVAEWIRTTDESAPTEKISESEEPSFQYEVSANSWQEAITFAANRPLRRITLKTSNPEEAKSLLELAQPFQARSLSLTVITTGELKDGGTVAFKVENAKVNSSIGPLDIAARLTRAVGKNLNFSSQLDLEFGETGEKGKESCLERARDTAPPGVEISAEFGLEDEN